MDVDNGDMWGERSVVFMGSCLCVVPSCKTVL